MTDIQISFSTNASKEEAEKLYIDYAAISDFTGQGFADNSYDGQVSFCCMPRFADPDLMQIFINIKDIAETILALSSICTGLFKFINKCKGYRISIDINICEEKSSTTSIQLKEDMTEEELEALLKNELKNNKV